MTDEASSIQVACPHCAAINRVPALRTRDEPHCGQCKGWLFVGASTPLTAQTYEAHALRSDLPLLIDFWAGWCQPCRMMGPHFEAAVSALEPNVRLAKIDIDAENDLASRFGIRGIPTVVLLRKGQEIARHSGVMQAPQIVDWVRDKLG